MLVFRKILCTYYKDDLQQAMPTNVDIIIAKAFTSLLYKTKTSRIVCLFCIILGPVFNLMGFFSPSRASYCDARQKTTLV